jgi:hypothetical protein
MPIFQPVYPDVNNAKPDFYALEISLPGLYSGPFPIGITAIQFSDNLEAGELRGNSPMMLAKTTGKYSAKCSLTLYEYEALNMIQFLGQLGAATVPNPLGAYEVAWNFSLNYHVPNQPSHTVQINGVRLGEVDNDYKSGQEALAVKFNLSPPYMIIRDGVVPFQPTQTFWPVNVTVSP